MLWTDWPLQWGLTDKVTNEKEQAADVIIVLADHSATTDDRLLLHPEIDRNLRDLAKRNVFLGKPGETAIIPTLGLLPQRYALFLGTETGPYTMKALRDALGNAGTVMVDYRMKKAVLLVPQGVTQAIPGHEPQAAAAAIMEGLLLGLYRRNSRSNSGRAQSLLEHIEFVLPQGTPRPEWDDGLRMGYGSANAVCYARELTNEPANLLTPAKLADEARLLAERYGLDYRIYDESEAAAEGMGGLLAVGKGSVNAPRMIVIRHRGNPDSQETLGIVGKGVTFDTGGISIKAALGMEEMISDMGGAAAIMGTMWAVGERKPALNIVAVIPAAENMPSGSAFKPGDVITTYSGKTVEVLNTDAEGRIVLADGLTTAIKEGATRLIDVATLTGAVMHALGDITTGAFSNEETMLQTFLQSARRVGEYVWPLPTYPEYKRLLKSDVADLKNHGGTWAGAIAGAMFIGSFAEEVPWIHLDIGGTAWMWSDRGFETKGGTGVMVRALLEYISDAASVD
ncbi:leucyl aminopeptidase [Cohnella endophytica]|uniref:Probable cytosol aminopeptidase n=1 Tax=Cohnella endophytica TaxID=2419778 RepID=A0A494XVN4_9BACL|nr:leucyl aminopeptidase [Cohnella endophytica]RKP53915.1 leucyl aminopeptidase [Cohnella endophytica]